MVAGGDIIYADDVNSLRTRLYEKANLTARASTVTYANDPDLVLIPLEVGTFEIELVMFFTLTTVNTQKIKTRWSFTGSWDNSLRACAGPGLANVGAPSAVTEVQSGAYRADDQDAIYDIALGGSYGMVREKATITVTTAGNLALSWAQSVSNAGATTVQPQSSFTIRRTF
jgi:hypothetical protein